MKKISDLSFILIFIISTSFSALLIDYQSRLELERIQKFNLVVKSYCDSLQDQIDYKFSEEFNNFYISFNNFPEDDGIKQIFLNFNLSKKNTNYTLGLDYHFLKPVYLSNKIRVHTVSNPFTMSSDTYSGDGDISFSLSLFVKFTNNEVCGNNLYKDIETKIVDGESKYFVDIKESIIPEWYFNEIPEDNIFYDFVQLSNELASDNFNSYGEISNKAEFLSIYDWDQENLEWLREDHHKLVSPVNLAFFGDFSDSELTAVAIFIEMMKDVAPDLEINLTTDQNDATLYIHKSLCAESSSTYPCNEIAGYYRSTFYDTRLKPNHGVIWVDEDSNNGAHVLIHELGHAFGLNHNNCFDSIVSTSYQEDDFMSLQPIDLAVLYAIYNNDFEYKKVNGHDQSIVLELNSYDQNFSDILNFPISWDACSFDYKEFEVSNLKLEFLADQLEKLYSSE